MKASEFKSADHTARNILTVGVVGGLLGGFLISMTLGAFNVGQGDDVTEWITAITSIAAVLVSSVAVVLVSQTLKATQDTLNETRTMSESQSRMAADQNYIGITQTRPWVCISDYSIYFSEADCEYTVAITVENFGPSPARMISMSIEIRHYSDWKDVCSSPPIYCKSYPAGNCSLIPPKKSFTFRVHPLPEEVYSPPAVTVFVSWEYRNHDGSALGNSEDQAEYFVNRDDSSVELEIFR
ncbi:hypothetical protein V6Z69_20785 [Cereibacter sphaeroides]|uniref:hypothetical protein n=1 Tax=Cereibacter sphaeroides TaxID=1063 RepID=UPI003990D9B2